jgi:type I restriction enzyme M protein
VPKSDLVTHGYDLSLSRYKDVIHTEVAHRQPQEILADLANLEEQIQLALDDLRGILE